MVCVDRRPVLLAARAWPGSRHPRGLRGTSWSLLRRAMLGRVLRGGMHRIERARLRGRKRRNSFSCLHRNPLLPAAPMELRAGNQRCLREHRSIFAHDGKKRVCMAWRGSLLRAPTTLSCHARERVSSGKGTVDRSSLLALMDFALVAKVERALSSQTRVGGSNGHRAVTGDASD